MQDLKIHNFKEFRIEEIKGSNMIEVSKSDPNYKKSLFNFYAKIGLYDFEQLKGTNYYFIFQKYGFLNSDIKDPIAIKRRLRDILDGDRMCVENYRDLTLGTEFKDLEMDVFWDTNNDIIIVKGEDSLKQLCDELLLVGFEVLGRKRNPEADALHIESAVDVPLITKTHSIEENKKYIK